MVPRFAYPALIFLQFVAARVTFPDSEVLQAPDLLATNRANFKCSNGCTVYVDKRYDLIKIMENGTVITDFSNLLRNFDVYGIELDPSDGYYIENQGEVNPSFVLYAVDRTATNNSTKVYAPEAYTQVFQTDRYLTVLSSFPAKTFHSFNGTFKDGYPRVYSTGFDAVNDERCQPAYRAKSQQYALNSRLTIPSAVLTVDFGEVGDFYSVAFLSEDGKNTPTSGATSVVYPSPGFVGCLFPGEEAPMTSYFSTLSGIEEKFTVKTSSMDVSVWTCDMAEEESITLRINSDEYGFYGNLPTLATWQYSWGTYSIDFSWTNNYKGITNYNQHSSFVVQLDFGLAFEPIVYTEKPSTSTITPTTTSSASGGIITTGLITSLLLYLL